MSIDDYPLKARDGIAITVTETYLKLVEVTKALNEPMTMRTITNNCDIPVCDRGSLKDALEHRKRMLQAVLKQQVGVLATMHRQSQ